MKKLLLATLMALLFTVCVIAQDDDDFGLWNEIVLTKPINKKVDFIIGSRFETKTNTSKVQEARIYSGFAFKLGKWTLQPQYVYVNAAKRTGGYFNEHRPSLIVTRKFVLDKNWTLTPGVRNEFRIRPGKNDFRFVPTFGIERSLNKKTKIFNRNELWFDSRKADPAQYRFRTFFGFNRTINKNLSIEPFFMYQRDQKFNPHHVYKFGVYWRVKL